MNHEVSFCTEINKLYGSFARERNKTKESEKKGRTIRKLDYKSGTNIQEINWFPFFPFPSLRRRFWLSYLTVCHQLFVMATEN